MIAISRCFLVPYFWGMIGGSSRLGTRHGNAAQSSDPANRVAIKILPCIARLLFFCRNPLAARCSLFIGTSVFWHVGVTCCNVNEQLVSRTEQKTPPAPVYLVLTTVKNCKYGEDLMFNVTCNWYDGLEFVPSSKKVDRCVESRRIDFLAQQICGSNYHEGRGEKKRKVFFGLMAHARME